MNKILAILILISPSIWADDVLAQSPALDSEQMAVDSERIDEFVEGLSDVQVAVVSVEGMVCDFCVRGIKKTFKKDKTVQKIDVDLDGGVVLLAYDINREISFKDIKTKIRANGQNATDLQIVKF